MLISPGHREAQNWPKNKHILCTTPETRFRQIPIFKIWLFRDLLLNRNNSLMKWFESQNIVFLAYFTKGISDDEKGQEG